MTASRSLRQVFAAVTLAALPFTLSACGSNLTVRTITLDQTFTATFPASTGGADVVVYSRVNQFAAIPGKLPGFLNLRLSGTVTASGTTAPLKSTVFVRSDLTPLLQDTSRCLVTNDAVICRGLGDAERAQEVGRLDLPSGGSGRFSLAGPALERAAQTGEGYFGLRLDEGGALPTSLTFTDLRAEVTL